MGNRIVHDKIAWHMGLNLVGDNCINWETLFLINIKTFLFNSRLILF